MVFHENNERTSFFLKIRNEPLILVIIYGLFLEFPVRFMVSPDPWVHSADHWYFVQPMRLLIELGFLILALAPFFRISKLKLQLSFNHKVGNYLFLVIGLILTTSLFMYQEWDGFLLINEKNLQPYIPIWFATGLVIGSSQEFTFRGLIYTGLDEKYGKRGAMIISTLFFVLGSIHSVRIMYSVLNDNLFIALLLLGVFASAGLLFAWIRSRTESILIPVVIHGLGNAITWSVFPVLKIHGL